MNIYIVCCPGRKRQYFMNRDNAIDVMTELSGLGDEYRSQIIECLRLNGFWQHYTDECVIEIYEEGF